MLFSVVIPAFNRAELLPKTLDSVWHQTFTDFEIIVVDDGSTDDTLEYLRSLGGRVRVFTQANKGPGGARNLAAKHARGDYLAFLDSDDLWFRWTLKSYEQIITESGRAAFIAGRPFRFRHDEDASRVASSELDFQVFSDYLASGEEWRWWGVSSFIIRRDVFRQVGGFTDLHVNAEDADLALRLGDKGRFVQVLGPPTFAYREHDVSAMKNFSASVAGAENLIREERRGAYPGEKSRSKERWVILTRHIRPTALGCLSKGLQREAWSLYRATFSWHLSLGRLRFLVAFPLLSIARSLRRPR